MNQAFRPQPPARVPIFNIPRVILAVLAVMVAIHGLCALLADETYLEVLRRMAFVPARLWTAFNPNGEAAHLAALAHTPAAANQVSAARFFLGDGAIMPWTLLTYGVLHANLMHLVLNMLWFVAFGAPVARRFGASRFLLLLAVATAAGALTHALTRPFDPQPVIGASAAVSGVVAAAIRFVFQPGESLGPRRAAQDVPRAESAPPIALSGLLRDRQVLGFLIVWFVLNFVFGVLSQPLGITEESVAWQAHVGGFLAGLLLFSLFDRRLAQA